MTTMTEMARLLDVQKQLTRNALKGAEHEHQRAEVALVERLRAVLRRHGIAGDIDA